MLFRNLRPIPARKHYTLEQTIGKLRNEMLRREVFAPLLEAKVLVERRSCHYNQARLPNALGYRPPRTSRAAGLPRSA